MSKRKNNSQHYFRGLVTIVTLLCLVCGTISVVQGCCKIAKTGVQLIVLHDDASFYNEQSRKTDEMTDDYNEGDAVRQKLYHSEDTIVRVFSNLPTILKFMVWVLSIIAIPGVPVLVLLYILQRIEGIRRRQRRQRERQKRSTSGTCNMSAKEDRFA